MTDSMFSRFKISVKWEIRLIISMRFSDGNVIHQI